MSRCTGHCCKSFWLPLSPMEFSFQSKKLGLGKPIKWISEEFRKISEMVIFQRPNDNGSGYRYTCKYFDTKTNNCINYKNRPDMCRDYPYGGTCKYKGCTLDVRTESEQKAISFEC